MRNRVKSSVTAKNSNRSAYNPLFPIQSGEMIETPKAYPLFGPQAKRILFSYIWEVINNSLRSDVDGETYEILWGYYTITVKHHYQCHDEIGGDSYCGIPELVSTLDEDSIEIIDVWDDNNETYCNDLCDELNRYGRENKLM